MDNMTIKVINTNYENSEIQIELYVKTANVEVCEEYNIDKLNMKGQLENAMIFLNKGESCCIDNKTKHNRLKSFLTKNRNEHLNFSIDISFVDSLGHLGLDIDLEVQDNELTDKHRCYFLVESDLGLVYNFIEEFISVLDGETKTAKILRY